MLPLRYNLDLLQLMCIPITYRTRKAFLRGILKSARSHFDLQGGIDSEEDDDEEDSDVDLSNEGQPFVIWKCVGQIMPQAVLSDSQNVIKGR